MRRLTLGLTLALACCLLAPHAQAQRKKLPSGREIATAAKAAKLDLENSGVAVSGKKKVKFTPIAPPRDMSQKEVANGMVVGELDCDPVPPFPKGIFPVYVAQVGDNFQAVAVSGDRIIAQAKKVEVEGRKATAKAKPTIEIGSVKITIRIGKVKITIEF